MYWAIYLRKVDTPVTSLKWAGCGYWSSDKYVKPHPFRVKENAEETIKRLQPFLHDDETIELWENNEWHMPAQFLSAHARTKS